MGNGRVCKGHLEKGGRGAGAEAAVIDASPGHSLILVSFYFVGGSVSG